jgi:predicted TIM-barrel fold metal-dependent hydrolase
MPDAKYNVISADSHVVEPPDVFEARVPASLKDRVPKLGIVDGGAAWLVEGVEPAPLVPTFATGTGWRQPSGPVTWETVLPGLHEPAARIVAQDSDSVDAEILYPTSGLWDAIKLSDDAEMKLACARAYNDWLAEFCAHDPNRLFGVAKIPTTSVADAVTELERAVKELGLKGALLDAFPSGAATGSNPEDEPFWELANELQVPVSLHYGVGADAPSLPEPGIGPGLKPPMANAMLPMVASGVFDRNPNLKVVFAHGDAGWALHWMEFFDINYVRQKHLGQYTLADDDAVPSDYLRKFAWFTVHQDRSAVRNRHLMGQVHLMWSSNFPYEDSNWPDNRQQAIRLTDEVSAQDRQALLADNVGRLYGLPGFEKGFSADEVAAFPDLVHF